MSCVVVGLTPASYMCRHMGESSVTMRHHGLGADGGRSLAKAITVGYLSVSLCVCLSVCPTVCLFVCLTICLSVCPTVWLSICPTVCLSGCPTVCLPA